MHNVGITDPILVIVLLLIVSGTFHYLLRIYLVLGHLLVITSICSTLCFYSFEYHWLTLFINTWTPRFWIVQIAVFCPVWQWYWNKWNCYIILNDKVLRTEQDDDDNDDGVPPPTLYACQSYFKRIGAFTVAQNNSELLVSVAR